MNKKINKLVEELFLEYSDSLFRYCYFKLGTDRELAKDIVEEAFYKLSIALLEWKKIDNHKSYLYKICSNMIIDNSRKNKPISIYDEQIDQSIMSYEDNNKDKIDAKLEVEKIYRILSKMWEDDKNLFILRFVEEYSPKEIAKILNKPTNNITVKLHRIKSKIQNEFNILD